MSVPDRSNEVRCTERRGVCEVSVAPTLEEIRSLGAKPRESVAVYPFSARETAGQTLWMSDLSSLRLPLYPTTVSNDKRSDIVGRSLPGDTLWIRAVRPVRHVERDTAAYLKQHGLLDDFDGEEIDEDEHEDDDEEDVPSDPPEPVEVVDWTDRHRFDDDDAGPHLPTLAQHPSPHTMWARSIATGHMLIVSIDELSLESGLTRGRYRSPDRERELAAYGRRRRQVARTVASIVAGDARVTVDSARARVLAQKTPDLTRWIKTCSVCHNRFEATKSNAVYCSSKCTKRAARTRRPS